MATHLRKWDISRNWFWWVICGTSLFLMIRTPVFGAEELKRYEFLQIRMGIPVKITLYAPSELIANQASKAAYDQFRKIDRIMSDYDPDSELMKLCRNATVGEAVAVSHELFEVLLAAQSLSQQTDGAFDVTVGPVVKLWRIARRRKKLPDPQRLKTALKSVGYQFLQLNEKNRSVTLLRPDMRLDLGAIAKGYAADQAMEALAVRGILSALIDAGGDIVAGSPPPGRDYWTIEVEKLGTAQENAGSVPVVKLKNAAIATSGDAYQYLEIDGKRYSHIVNSLTGMGLTTSSTVTVIAPTGMQADSLASAVSVISDPVQRLQLVQDSQGGQLFMFTLEADGNIQKTESPGFAEYLKCSGVNK